MPHHLYAPDLSSFYPLPNFLTRVPAGFPSPADDYMDGPLDLTRHLVQHPNSTFLVTVTGDSMIGAGIHAGDLLVMDRSLKPRNGDVVLAVVGGDVTVKRLRLRKEGPLLEAANPDYPPIQLGSEQELEIWGVAVHAVHRLRG